MFGLSTKELLIKSIKGICVNNLQIYENAVKDAKSNITTDTSAEEVNKIMLPAMVDYFNSCFDTLWEGMRSANYHISERMRLGLIEPAITGVPKEIDTDYLCEHGISAGTIYAIAYYAIKNKPINLKRDAKTLSMLNNYQIDLMNLVLASIDK